MDLNALIAALRKLGVTIADGADLAAITSAVTAQCSAKAGADAQMANERTALATAQQELTAVRGDLTAVRTELVNERAQRATLLIDDAIRSGRITEADRAALVPRFAADFANTATELAARQPAAALNTKARATGAQAMSVTSGLADRRAKVQELVNERVKAGATYDDAFGAVRKEKPELFGETK